MLIYFTPALYCDVSDAWMLSSKRQRVWVTFAGGYFQLVVWGCAAVVWRITAQETLISNLALAAVTFGGTQTLLNFNPLIKLDGYYMLSDYLEIPNLREKAFRAFHAWLALRPDPLLSSQARRPLLTYAVLAVAFSMLLLGVVYANIYWFATTHFQFAGLVAFIFFMGLTLKRAATEPAAGARALATRAVLKKYRTFGVVAIILLAMLIPWELRIAAEFEVLPNEESIVRSETAGTISAIHVREGSRVEREEVLAELVDFARARELSQVVGNLGQKEAELALLVAGPRPEEIAQAQRLVETRQTELDNVRRNIQEGNRLREELAARQAEVRLAERELDQARLLFADGLGPRFDVERWEETVEIRTRAMNATATGLEILAETNDREGDLKSRELAQAESDLTLLMAGSRNEEIDQRRAEVSALRRQEAILKEELEKNLIRAPIAGTVVTPFIERLQNQHFDPGDEFARIVEVDQVTASLLVPEKELAEVRIGSRVVLKARSYPASDFEGTVRVIAPVA
jgi:multidrug efflux pump subunit AcrA (membrane-fusion protein)